MTDASKTGLSLVHSIDDKTLQFRQLLERACLSEFGRGSFEAVLRDEASIFKRGFVVKDPQGDDQDHKRACETIVAYLQKEGCILRADQIDLVRIKGFGDGLALNLGMIQFMSTTDRPDLPLQNLDRHRQEFGDYLFRIAEQRSHREEIEYKALRPAGIDVLDQDVTRLLLHQINHDRLIPRVLVLPNMHKPYNPFLVLLEGNRLFPSEIARLFHLFAF